MANMGNISRRLDALERALGDGGSDDYGPSMVITLRRYWRGAGAGDGGEAGEDVGRLGALREQRIIDETVAELRAEARARREHLGHVIIGVDRDGTVKLAGVPWRRREPSSADDALSALSHMSGVARPGDLG